MSLRTPTSDDASVIIPVLPTVPNVGRNPVIPIVSEGQDIEPHVSVPMANGTKAAEVAAPGQAKILAIHDNKCFEKLLINYIPTE